MNRSFSPPPPPPADTSSSTPAFFAEDDESNDSHDEYSDRKTAIKTNKQNTTTNDRLRMSHESQSSVSTTSLILERISDRAEHPAGVAKTSQKQDRMSDFDDDDPLKDDPADEADYDLETGPFLGSRDQQTGSATDLPKNPDRKSVV